MERIARDESLFTYLSECPGEHRVVLGDARISLEDAPDGLYGLIVGDAFSSDAIPVHLLTREALDLYFTKLQDDGVLATHVSNRHLDLEPVLGNAARDAGLACRSRVDDTTVGTGGGAQGDRARRRSPSHWVVMSRAPRLPDALASDPRWHPCATEPRSRVWTDDYSNVVGAFR